MSLSQAYSRRTIALTVIIIAGFYALSYVRPMVGIRLYSAGLILLLLVTIPLIWWQVRKTFPTGGIGATAERSIPVPVPFERAFEAAAGAARHCGWKLTDTDSGAGILKGKIGRTIRTGYGQLFTIAVNQVTGCSSMIDITCSALYQTKDLGGNDEMIGKFRNCVTNRLSAQ